MNDGTTLARVKALVGDAIGHPASAIGDDIPLGKEPKPRPSDPLGQRCVGLDSLELIQLGLAIQEHFGIDIPDADLDRPSMGTPAGIADYIDARMLQGPDPEHVCDALAYGYGVAARIRGRGIDFMAKDEMVTFEPKQPWLKPELREITDLAEITQLTEQFVNATRDADMFGIGITKGGERIDPRDFYETGSLAFNETLFAWFVKAIEAGESAGRMNFEGSRE